MQAIAAYMATVNCVPRLQPPPGTETMQRGKTRPPVTLGRHPSELRDAREPPIWALWNGNVDGLAAEHNWRIWKK
jgi:hypothetical protein